MKFNSSMIQTIFVLIIFLFNISAFAQEDTLNGAPAKLQFNKDHYSHNAGPGGSPGSPLLTYRNGSVLRTNSTAAIFWGGAWNSPSFTSDKITGLDTFFQGFSNSSYAKTSSEYYDSIGFISSSSNYIGHTIDTSAVPSRALKVSQAVAEVCKITNNAPDANTTYFIYTSSKAGQVNYCAWHSWGTCANGASVQVAYMPNIDGIAGCDPQDSTTGHSEGLSALANVTAHELLEAITDPRGQGWVDSSGAENGDKCAWSFPTGDGISTLYNGSKWKLQMEWSNAAYTAGTGLLNRSGQKGCIF
jgi:hypothetical protein